ncbi:MAG: hypothetical protein MJ164_02395 [Alphaproteobacteria bacterium]|nr:hypothetical protein [Alphaproteobacteria bacterium]
MVSQKNLGFWYTVCKGKKPRNSKEKLSIRESKKMHKKMSFLRVFQKIALFACVFCAFSAWADTTCDTNFTPIMGNSIQNGTPTPENPVEVVSVGNKNKNLFDKTQGTIQGYPTAGYTWYVGGYERSIVVKLEEGKTYTVVRAPGYKATFRIQASATYPLADGQTLQNIDSTGGSDETTKTITVPTGYPYVVIYVSNSSPYTEEKEKAICDAFMVVEGSAAPTEYIPYGYRIPGTSIYLDEPLRKVGNYADELRPDGTVIRRVGVKVFDGTENWTGANPGNYFYISNSSQVTGHRAFVSNYYKQSGNAFTNTSNYTICAAGAGTSIQIRDERFENVSAFKSWLAQQYAAGTPVTVYYPLATEVVENWSCGPIAEIKIATTKMVEDEFAVAEANLAATVQTIESVVSRTISQTEQIQVLQDTKQTRPDESCPANMKCLLVQDEDGTPHWYPIIEP